MFARDYTALSFPRRGEGALSNYGVPSNSGTAPVTELRNILDTSWAEDAIRRSNNLETATTFGKQYDLQTPSVIGETVLSAALTLGGGGCCPTGGSGGSGYGSGGSSSSRSQCSTFNLSSLDAILKASGGNVGSTVADLEVARALQSLTRGLADSVSSTASTISQLVDKCVGAQSSAESRLIAGVALDLLNEVDRSVGLFTGAFQLAAAGKMKVERFEPGDILSGRTKETADLLALANRILDLPANISKMIDKGAAMVDNLIAMGIKAVMAPMIALQELADAFKGVVGAVTGLVNSIASTISKMVSSVLGVVSSMLGRVQELFLGDIEGIYEGLTTFLTAQKKKIPRERIKGMTFLDNDWVFNWMPLDMSPSADRGVPKYNGDTPSGRNPIYNLANGGMKMPNYSGVQTGTGIGATGAGIGSTASKIAVASAIAATPPIAGSYLGVTDDNGYLGAANSTSNSIVAALAEAMTFNTSMRGALDGIQHATTKQVDTLLSALECRRSTYADLSSQISASMLGTDNMLNKLKGLGGLLNSGSYKATCSTSALLGGSA